MAEGTRLGRLEEMTLSNKHEIATLSRGLIEANERIADTQTQLHTIEQLLRDCLDAKPKSSTVIIEEEIPRPFNFNSDTNRPWKLKYLETFGIPEEQRIRVLSFHLVGAAYAWYRWGVNN
ncbi:hypothetical protein PIB30_088720 [Stylosanthes scabra]|uniref:Retrotransposon gag domain-containing protein n=1 Tax=Stylosanthes scabra TaxID=79078 RepID=A0ABU6QU95_9FABA|nr:hypothetical protein [Stylosanthes scabra]